MIRNVIFDMDGVILDTERLYIECCVPAAEKLGLAGIVEVAKECTGLTDEETRRRFREHYGENAPLEEFYQETFRTFMDRFNQDGVPLKEGVVELLEFLKRAGAKIAIGSSTEVEIIRMELREVGVLDYFDVIVGGDMAKASKPAPDIFLLAAEKLGQDIRDCIIIEDSFNGVRAARSAGGIVFMVPDLLQPTEEIRALTDRVFGSLDEVREWLEENKSRI